MEKLRQQTTKNEELVNLNDLFMKLFTSEFLESLSPEQIDRVNDNLKQIESESGPETIPSQWLALRSVLRKRGYLE